MVGILLSYWEGLLSEAMVVSGRVYRKNSFSNLHPELPCVMALALSLGRFQRSKTSSSRRCAHRTSVTASGTSTKSSRPRPPVMKTSHLKANPTGRDFLSQKTGGNPRGVPPIFFRRNGETSLLEIKPDIGLGSHGNCNSRNIMATSEWTDLSTHH